MLVDLKFYVAYNIRHDGKAGTTNNSVKSTKWSGSYKDSCWSK